MAVLLAGVRPSSEYADRWLVQLRWAAIAGMTATVVVARSFAPRLETTPLFLILGLITLVNLGWMVAIRRAQSRAAEGAPGFPDAAADLRPLDGTPPQASAPASHFVEAQIIGDVLALTAMLWFAGGVLNPFAAFLAFQIALAGLLCTHRTTLGIALLTLAVILVLTQAAPLPLEGLPGERARSIKLAEIVSLVALTAFLAVFVSVYTERLESVRRESARNEKLAMLGRLVGAMSHELGNPLATVLLASHDLADLCRELGNAEAERLAGTIESEARRASDIIGLVRGHIRPDLTSERVELTSFVRSFASAELGRLGFRGECVFNLPEPVSVMVLKPAFGQVLLNVLTNAAEASAVSSAPSIVVSVLRHGDAAEVVVEDSGPGFSEEMLARAGEPFQSTKEAQGGMGLGLYVSSVLARRMNALLRVENAQAGGAKVTLSIGRISMLTQGDG